MRDNFSSALTTTAEVKENYYLSQPLDYPLNNGINWSQLPNPIVATGKFSDHWFDDPNSPAL